MNYWHNTKLKILNFTHCAMDGAGAGIVIKNYFNDSYLSAVSSFVKEEKISVEELRELISEIENKND